MKRLSKWLIRLMIAAFLTGGMPWPTAEAASKMLIDDDAHSLSAAGWTRQYAPREGNYITDEPNSLGNPSGFAMKQVLRGQYLFYSSANGKRYRVTFNGKSGDTGSAFNVADYEERRRRV